MGNTYCQITACCDPVMCSLFEENQVRIKKNRGTSLKVMFLYCFRIESQYYGISFHHGYHSFC